MNKINILFAIKRINFSFYLLFAGLFTVLLTSELNGQGCFPQDKLPSHITFLTEFGQRSEWSLDGQQIYFVDKAGSEVWAVDVKTKVTRQITRPRDRPNGHGYYRVFTLWNDNLLMGHGAERHKLHFQIWDDNLQNPQPIKGEYFDEGPAVSRESNKIAWTTPGQSQIYTGEIVYTDKGEPEIVNKKLVIDNKHVIDDRGVKYEEILETQDWHPFKDDILIWNQYLRNEHGFRSDVMSVNLSSGEIFNHTKSPTTYDEAEGIFPDREYTLVESDQHRTTGDISGIEIYKLRLDGTTTDYQRLTYFTEVEGFRASNPVISDDGNFIAFQASLANSGAGAGCGLYLFDLEKFKKGNR